MGMALAQQDARDLYTTVFETLMAELDALAAEPDDDDDEDSDDEV